VIIPTRNREEALGECLDRLLAEEPAPYEIIVVDASATSATQELLQRYPTVINHHRGDVPFSMVENRNIGLSIAQGEVVAYIDDDCYVWPGWMQALTQAFNNTEIIAAGGRIIYHPWKVCKHGPPIVTIDLDRDIIWGEFDRIVDSPLDVPTLPGGNLAVRRAAALEVNGFDTNYIGSANLEETDFILRISSLGKRIVFLPDAVVEHRALPRPDKIERAFTNYIFRYSAVRNRLYFLRKHKARGLGIGIRRQAVDAGGGTLKYLSQAVVFAAASVAGIVVGLLVKPEGKSKGLNQT
jgi:glycosyltransferase involved in cell wall biosynthesis